MKRGEVWWAELFPRSGSEQSGRRPVVVVSHDGFNAIPAWRSVIVVPLSTSDAQARRGPTAIGVPRGTAGLSRSSVAVCHQVTTIDRSKLTRHVGTLPAEVLAEIEFGLKAALCLV
jgi:mRNA interferase MazF